MKYVLFPTHKSLKQGNVLSPFLSDFPQEFANREPQGNQKELKLTAAYLLLVYADFINLMGQIYIHGEINIRLNSANCCYHSFQNFYVAISYPKPTRYIKL